MNHNQPIILVTGASRGIGLEIVKQLAARGAQVLLTARDRTVGEAAIAGTSARDHVSVLELDVTSASSIADLAKQIAQRYARLDVLINNAGVNLDANSTGANVSADTLRRTFETNTIAPLQIIQALLPLLRESAAPRIINISSSLAATGNPTAMYPAYRLSKAALNALTIHLASELADQHIVVNSACPGWTRTDLGGPQAPKSVQEGADTPVWLALDAPVTITGKFVSDRAVIAW